MVQKRLSMRAFGALLVASMIFGSSMVVNLERLHAAPISEPGMGIQATAVININVAGFEELQAVRGIGPSLAERIIEYREEHGPFEQPDDLAFVRGIGSAKLEKIKPQIVV